MMKAWHLCLLVGLLTLATAWGGCSGSSEATPTPTEPPTVPGPADVNSLAVWTLPECGSRASARHGAEIRIQYSCAHADCVVRARVGGRNGALLDACWGSEQALGRQENGGFVHYEDVLKLQVGCEAGLDSSHVAVTLGDASSDVIYLADVMPCPFSWVGAG